MDHLQAHADAVLLFRSQKQRPRFVGASVGDGDSDPSETGGASMHAGVRSRATSGRGVPSYSNTSQDLEPDEVPPY